ncbi:hypothetical protein [Pseudomonas sp. HY13-MNA-CIBAN-0226]|uniref:hypothetical protein n=1 Tax=Pseudomonas sp. HY13-MNA-CIBAN-0226 TaxID=3140473 RepID=UPI00332809EC
MANKFPFAHIRQQGQDMIIVPVDAAFANKTSKSQQEFVAAFESAVNRAGLAGHAVAIWNTGRQIGFVAPTRWHGFFKSPGIWELVHANINKEIAL